MIWYSIFLLKLFSNFLLFVMLLYRTVLVHWPCVCVRACVLCVYVCVCVLCVVCMCAHVCVCNQQFHNSNTTQHKI